jgi:hypothetical protein
MAEHRYSVILTPAEEGGFEVTCPALPGLVTEGDTPRRSASHGARGGTGLYREPAKGRVAHPRRQAAR